MRVVRNDVCYLSIQRNDRYQIDASTSDNSSRSLHNILIICTPLLIVSAMYVAFLAVCYYPGEVASLLRQYIRAYMNTTTTPSQLCSTYSEDKNYPTHPLNEILVVKRSTYEFVACSSEVAAMHACGSLHPCRRLQDEGPGSHTGCARVPYLNKDMISSHCSHQLRRSSRDYIKLSICCYGRS